MLALINTSIYQLFTPEKAESIAQFLTENDEDGWTYKAQHDPTGQGWSFVEIYDETGELLGKL